MVGIFYLKCTLIAGNGQFRYEMKRLFSNYYINNIENKKSLPSMPSFFYICEYLGVTLQEFFDEGNANPEALNEFIAQARQLDSRSFEYILGIMKELNTKR